MYPPYEPFVEAEMAYRRDRISVHFGGGTWIRQQRVARRPHRTGRRRALRRTGHAVVSQ